MREEPKSGEGRLPDNAKERVALRQPRDISHIDCQEGNLERGETGGNFTTERNTQSNEEKNPQ